MKKFLLSIALCLISSSALAQSGGPFTLEQTVIGNGGWRSDGGIFTMLGTMGQSNSGSSAAGGRFNMMDGMWAMEDPNEHSPFATITGQVFKQHGQGIPRVLVTISSANGSFRAETWTGAKGEYRFANVPTGANYLITVRHNNFEFEPASVVLFISQDRPNIDFASPHP